MCSEREKCLHTAFIVLFEEDFFYFPQYHLNAIIADKGAVRLWCSQYVPVTQAGLPL